MRLPVRLTLLLVSAVILAGACVETYQIAWGTGVWLGQFAPTWFLAFSAFVLFSAFLATAIYMALWQPQRVDRWLVPLAKIRRTLRAARWWIAAVFLFLPVYLLQYTFWGIVLHGIFLRVMFVLLFSWMIAWILSDSDSGSVEWVPLVTSLLMMTGVISIFEPLGSVTSYPFSLGWSEGNRLWDYSVMFGRERYLYPDDKIIPVFLEQSRQFVGAIPFLYSNVRIEQVRLWLALVDIVPYLLLGWVTFYGAGRKILPWLLAGIWAFAFLRQGPIHPPLLICAIVVALAWKRPLWLAIPMIFASGYYAEASRFTWLFAPAMWSVLLEFASAPELNRLVWKRSVAVGVAGVLGGYVAPFILPNLITGLQLDAQTHTATGAGNGVSLSSVQSQLSAQSLLWDRLLPNSTYGPGILFGILMATLPLIVVLLYLAGTRQWHLHGWQKVSIILPLLAFLVVGLIVSVKIGGGGDLHNLDMFIIGLMFAGAIAWHNGADQWIRQPGASPVWVRLALIVVILLPVFQPLRHLRPLSSPADRQLVATLGDIEPKDPLPDPLPDTLPGDEDVRKALNKILSAIDAAAPSGEILFMDQRQLLTFGVIQNIPLVPDYDKKLLIDKALSGDRTYFETFYNDLSAHRFSLIITSPVNRRLDSQEGHFGEENNAWVTWVTKPLLCYYQPLDLLKKVDVELLVPRTEPINCESELP